MIAEDYVSFEIAKLLKEKGFYQDFFEPLIPVWHYNGARMVLSFTDESSYPAKWEEWYSAPTLQRAMKWLRKVHNIHIASEPYCGYDTYSIFVWKDYQSIDWMDSFHTFKTHEDGVESVIKYCLEELV